MKYPEKILKLNSYLSQIDMYKTKNKQRLKNLKITRIISNVRGQNPLKKQKSLKSKNKNPSPKKKASPKPFQAIYLPEQISNTMWCDIKDESCRFLILEDVYFDEDYFENHKSVQN